MSTEIGSSSSSASSASSIPSASSGTLGTSKIPDVWICCECGHENKRTGDEDQDAYCHRQYDDCDFDNHCRLPYDYTRKHIGTPSNIWREQREAYKSAIIYDLPAKIPSVVAPHLQSEIERLMYKLTKRTIKISVDTNYQHPHSHGLSITPMQRMKALDTFKSKGTTRAIRKHYALESLYNTFEDAFHHTRQHMCKEYFSNSLFCIKSMDRIDAELEGREGRIARGEFVKHEDLIVNVRGSKGETYKVNCDRSTCTCKAYEYRDWCKHVEKGYIEDEICERLDKVREAQERDEAFRAKRLEKAYQASLEFAKNAEGADKKERKDKPKKQKK